MRNLDFEIYQVIKRTDIHQLYGGSGQNGISQSAKHPYIFIFTGTSGHKHGYKDEWIDDNIFAYTGEGQVDDMEFVRGNLNLREHVTHGKRVFLFTYTKKAYVRYDGELEVIGFDYFIAPDRNKKMRNAIRFFLKKIGSNIEIPTEFIKQELLHADKKNLEPGATERKGLITSRVGQGAYRKSILLRWKFRCAVTNYTDDSILVASHIHPWSKSTDEERLDVHNGILLSPTYDALFDKHLISFENNGKIIIGDTLSKKEFKLLGVTGKEVIKELSVHNLTYLERHRNNLF